MADGLTDLEVTILNQFSQDLEKGYTINGLAKAIGKSYPNVHRAVRRLLDDKILKKEVIGHSHHCKLNFTNDETYILLGLVQVRKRQELFRKNPKIRQVVNKSRGNKEIILVWKRERDVLIVVENRESIKKVKMVNTITKEEFLGDKRLVATTGAGTLLYGFVNYPTLLKEVFK